MPYRKGKGYAKTYTRTSPGGVMRNRIMSPKQKVIALAGRLFKTAKMK